MASIQTEITPHKRLRTPAAAAYVNLGVSTLEKYRVTGGGPRYQKLGRTVVYLTDDLDRWCDLRSRTSTSDTGPGGAS